MGYRNRMRDVPVSRTVIDTHNRHDGTTWGDQAWEREQRRAKQEAAEAAMEMRRLGAQPVEEMAA